MKKTIATSILLSYSILSSAQGWVGNSNALYPVNTSLGLTPLNVGIGTNAPAAQLHTTGSVRFQGLTVNNAYNTAVVADANGNLALRDVSTFSSSDPTAWKITGNADIANSNFLGTTDNAALRFKTNNVERMIVTSAGRVGIGTSNPDVQFHLVSGAAGNMAKIYENMVVERSTDVKLGVYVTNSAPVNVAGASIALGYSNFTDNTGLYPSFEMQYGMWTGTNSLLRFNVLRRDAAGNFQALQSRQNVLVLDDQGRIGINLTNGGAVAPVNPTANLHSLGTVRFQNLPTGQGNILVIDAQGNVFRSNQTAFTSNNTDNNTTTLTVINQLAAEVEELKNQLSQMKVTAAKRNNNSMLFQNQPNPQIQSSNIKYYVTQVKTSAYLIISDLQGKQLRKYFLPEKDGNGEINITKNELQAGMYIYSLIVDNQEIDTKKLVIL